MVADNRLKHENPTPAKNDPMRNFRKHFTNRRPRNAGMPAAERSNIKGNFNIIIKPIRWFLKNCRANDSFAQAFTN
jgi:hypothetical protein